MPEAGPGPQPKSAEALKAQAASFAVERLPEAADQAAVLNNLDLLAADAPDSIHRVTERVEHPDKTDLSRKIPKGTELVVATREQLDQYLKEVGGARHESIATRIELLEAYRDFEPAVEGLIKGLDQYKKAEDHPNFLGSGSNVDAFRVRRDDKDYVVRLEHHYTLRKEQGNVTDPAETDRRMRTQIHAKGIPHLEQIAAASYEDGVIVSELMPGRDLGQVSVADLEQVTEEQLSEFVDTVMAASAAGVHIDPKPSNFLLDRQTGINIVDLSSVDPQKPRQEDALGTLKVFADNLASAGVSHGDRLIPKTRDDYELHRKFAVAGLPVIERYRQVCEERFEGEVSETLIDSIDAAVTRSQEKVAQFGDEAWVANEVMRAAKLKEQVAAREAARAALAAAGGEKNEFVPAAADDDELME